MNRDARIKSAPQTAMELAFSRAVQAHATKRPKPPAPPPVINRKKEPRHGNP